MRPEGIGLMRQVAAKWLRYGIYDFSADSAEGHVKPF